MAFLTGSTFAGAKTATKTVTCRRSSTRTVTMQAGKQGGGFLKAAGFTADAETLNGRLAMMGFIIAVATEVLNKDHPTIVQQVLSLLGK